VTVTDIQLFTHHFIMVGCVLLTLFMQIWWWRCDDEDS